MNSNENALSKRMVIDLNEQSVEDLPPSPELVAFLELIGRALAEQWIQKQLPPPIRGPHENTNGDF